MRDPDLPPVDSPEPAPPAPRFAAQRRVRLLRRLAPRAILASAVLAAGASATADDWPQWLGPQRDGVWRETGLLEQFPAGGLPVRWRVPVGRGYVGPAVAGGRLYLVDRQAGTMPPRTRGDRTVPSIPGTERVCCLDAATGATLWETVYDCSYRIAYDAGPRATPVVAGGRVYTLGAMGDLKCLNATNGQVLWARRLLQDFGLADPPFWGYASHPLLDGDRLICLVGGTGSAVAAFDKHTGRELWRALTAVEVGYAPPVICVVQGKRHLIVWHPDAVCGLVPETGRVLWTQPYPPTGKPRRPEVTIATPRWDGRRLFVTTFYHGALLLEPGADSVRVVWNRKSTRQSVLNDGLHGVISTPLFRDGCIYGVCGFGELRCLDAATGNRRWETRAATGGASGLFATVFMVEQGDRCWLWNDQGELILARLAPAGYTELGRCKVLEPAENTRGRNVLWCHPAFANRHLYAHNGRELIAVSLEAPSPALRPRADGPAPARGDAARSGMDPAPRHDR
ncbi:MAG: PQQ-like beta-propeller repeat protein [Verrucomicrobia bacterium]|nr:PQQ-like beta-propeller repeat protein [Verrucomicrobiota bacterium]